MSFKNVSSIKKPENVNEIINILINYIINDIALIIKEYLVVTENIMVSQQQFSETINISINGYEFGIDLFNRTYIGSISVLISTCKRKKFMVYRIENLDAMLVNTAYRFNENFINCVLQNHNKNKIRKKIPYCADYAWVTTNYDFCVAYTNLIKVDKYEYFLEDSLFMCTKYITVIKNVDSFLESIETFMCVIKKMELNL
jgi:hypothetical protein